jgi:membrane protease YdiL (CAAX protease family)
LSAIWKRLLLFVLGAAFCVLLYLFLLNFPPVSLRSRTAGVIPVMALAASTAWLTARFLRADGLSAAVLGIGRGDRPVARFGLGFLAGCGLTGLWLGIVTMAAGASWHRNPTFSVLALLLAAAFNFFNNTGEELVYRGYLFVRLADAWGATLTVLVTSGAFALLHLQAGIPWLSVLAGVFTSGLIFAAIFARWRSLPLALGFHVATNIAQDVAGLRTGAASLFAPKYPAGAPGSGQAVLAGIAVLNVAVAIGILAWPRRQRGAGSRSGLPGLSSGLRRITPDAVEISQNSDHFSDVDGN